MTNLTKSKEDCENLKQKKFSLLFANKPAATMKVQLFLLLCISTLNVLAYPAGKVFFDRYLNCCCYSCLFVVFLSFFAIGDLLLIELNETSEIISNLIFCLFLMNNSDDGNNLAITKSFINFSIKPALI